MLQKIDLNESSIEKEFCEKFKLKMEIEDELKQLLAAAESKANQAACSKATTDFSLEHLISASEKKEPDSKDSETFKDIVDRIEL